MERYIVVGDNNFWYSTFTASSQQEISKAVDDVIAGIAKGDFSTEGLDSPTELYVTALRDRTVTHLI